MYLHLIPILYEAALNCLNRPYSGRVGLLKQSPPAWAKFGTSLIKKWYKKQLITGWGFLKFIFYGSGNKRGSRIPVQAARNAKIELVAS